MIRKTFTVVPLIGAQLTGQIVISLALGLLVALMGGWIARVLMRRFREWKNARYEIRNAKDSGTLCAGYGYNMEGEAIPRCPECGALRGFTTSVDQLGLTEEEIGTGF